MRRTIATLFRLRLPPWLRQPRTYPLVALLPIGLGTLFVLELWIASVFREGALGRRVDLLYGVLVAVAAGFLLLVVPAMASKALLRGDEDDDLALLAAHGAGVEELYVGALLVEGARGLLVLWTALPVLAVAALLLRPSALVPTLLLLVLVVALGASCGVAASALAPSRLAALALALVGVSSVVIGALLVSARLPWIDGSKLVTPMLAMAASALTTGWLGLWAMRRRGLELR